MLDVTSHPRYRFLRWQLWNIQLWLVSHMIVLWKISLLDLLKDGWPPPSIPELSPSHDGIIMRDNSSHNSRISKQLMSFYKCAKRLCNFSHLAFSTHTFARGKPSDQRNVGFPGTSQVTNEPEPGLAILTALQKEASSGVFGWTKQY